MSDAPLTIDTPKVIPVDPLSGIVFAVSAFTLWGLFPIYLKAVALIPAWEVVMHRVVWSVPFALIILALMGRMGELRAALKQPKTLAFAALTAALISVNWGVYVWAIAAERAVEGALGYYINPLVNVVLAAAFLGERLNRLQALAICFAVVGVAILTVAAGGLPWVSLVLAFSFGFYGFFRKTIPLGAVPGFTLEVIILSVVAMPVLLYIGAQGTGTFGTTGLADMGLLGLAGPVTAIPLILYATGARLLRYTTIGVLNYIAPTLIFLIAVFVFKEPFSMVQLLAFCFIWTALALYTVSLYRARRPA